MRGPAEQGSRKARKPPTGPGSLSCHRFRASEVRLLLGVIAYSLGNLLRRLVLPVAIQTWSLTSLQQRFFKTSARLIRDARYFTLRLAESFLTGRLFRQILDPAGVSLNATVGVTNPGNGGSTIPKGHQNDSR
jgi:hypothetical protein